MNKEVTRKQIKAFSLAIRLAEAQNKIKNTGLETIRGCKKEYTDLEIKALESQLKELKNDLDNSN